MLVFLVLEFYCFFINIHSHSLKEAEGYDSNEPVSHSTCIYTHKHKANHRGAQQKLSIARYGTRVPHISRPAKLAGEKEKT